MNELSQEEKNHIRAEMLYREAVRRESELPKGKWAKFWSGCAHPVVITVLGGLLIASAGALFQHLSAINQQELLRQRQLLDKKFALLSSFTEQFEKDMSLLYNLRSTHLEIKELMNASTPSARDELKRLRTRYENMAEEHWKKHREIGSILEIRVLFTSIEVHKAADELEKHVNSLLHDEVSPQQLEKLNKETQDGMRRLAIEMGKEINQSR